MKSKTVKRLLCGVVSLLLLVSLVPSTAFAARIGTSIAHYDADTGNLLTEEAGSGAPLDVFPDDLIERTDWGTGTTNLGDMLSGPDLPAGEYTPEIPNDQREYTIKGVKYTLDYISITLDDRDFGFGDGTGEVKTFEFKDLDNLTPITIPEDVNQVAINYHWKVDRSGEVEPEPGTPPTITNFIFSVDRNVSQNGAQLTATKNEEDIDVYSVMQGADGKTDGLTVTYDTSMNMENLGISGLEDSEFSGFADNAWGLLKMFKNRITDKTWVDLTFRFDEKINVATDVDYSEAHLDSNMFVLKEDAPYTVDEENNALIVHCRWDSASATAEALDPMIYFNDLKINLPSDWNDATSITIKNGGDVVGEVDANLGSRMKIDGGVADDTFILALKEKVSEPGMDKVIRLPDGALADKDTVAAGDEVNFVLNSTVPENFSANIEYTYDPGSSTAVGIAGGDYELVFHDQMDDVLIDPDNFEVMIGDTALNADQYTLVQTGLGDGCDFELTLDLVELYNNHVFTDSDLGVTPITVSYTAQLKEGTPAGEYENAAWVSYPDDQSEEDIVTVDTYAIDIFKFDQANKAGLAGAEFELRDAEGNLIATAISDSDGHAVINGLDAGKYTLVETKAPDGYVKSDTPLTITIPDGAGEDHTVEVEFANSEIPHTGGMGTTLFTIGGAAIIVGAGVVFAVTRKRKKVND